MALPDQKRRFWRISAARILFQGGAAAVDSSTTIAMLDYLMEISPDDRRPAYSGYFNALVAPAEDAEGERLTAMTYITEGKERDGNPSLRYITLLREGERAHGLPVHYIRFLESVKHAE